jgi:uridylate kinase
MGDRTPKYNRILLKLSGEALGGKRDYGIDLEVVQTIAGQVKRVHEMGVQIALVVGGGNIFRGLAASERPRSRCLRSQSPTSGAARCVIWKRAAS